MSNALLKEQLRRGIAKAVERAEKTEGEKKDPEMAALRREWAKTVRKFAECVCFAIGETSPASRGEKPGTDKNAKLLDGLYESACDFRDKWEAPE